MPIDVPSLKSLVAASGTNLMIAPLTGLPSSVTVPVTGAKDGDSKRFAMDKGSPNGNTRNAVVITTAATSIATPIATIIQNRADGLFRHSSMPEIVSTVAWGREGRLEFDNSPACEISGAACDWDSLANGPRLC